MNWTFNQDCQLIIEEQLNKGEFANSVEIIWCLSDNSFKTFLNRSNGALVVDIDKDGLYRYLCLFSNRPFTELRSLTLDPNFLQYLTLPNNSIGNPQISEEIFSICHLRKCALAHEKQAIEEFLSICNKKNCNKKSSQQSTRDILLISVFVLEHLISRHRYSEAETILDALSSCKNICGDSVTKTCCCNG